MAPKEGRPPKAGRPHSDEPPLRVQPTAADGPTTCAHLLVGFGLPEFPVVYSSPAVQVRPAPTPPAPGSSPAWVVVQKGWCQGCHCCSSRRPQPCRRAPCPTSRMERCCSRGPRAAVRASAAGTDGAQCSSMERRSTFGQAAASSSPANALSSMMSMPRSVISVAAAAAACSMATLSGHAGAREGGRPRAGARRGKCSSATQGLGWTVGAGHQGKVQRAVPPSRVVE